MPAVAALLSLCFGALPPCPSGSPPQCSAVLAPVTGSAASIAVSHNDELAAVAAFTHGLHVYIIATGDPVTVPSYSLTLDVAFSPDSTKVAVALGSGGVAIARLGSGTHLWSSGGYCSFVAFSPDGTRVASSHSDSIIRIRDAETGDLVQPLTGGHTREASLTYTIDGGRLISGSWDNTVVVWDATTGAILKTLTDHTDIVISTFVSPDGLYFASAGKDAVNIYKLSDYSLHKTIPKGAPILHGMSFSRDWSKFVTLGHAIEGPVGFPAYGDLEVYSVETGSLVKTYPTGGTVWAVSYFRTSDAIITGGSVASGSSIFLWDYVSPPPTPLPTPTPPIECGTVVLTQGMGCEPGYSLISPYVATRCRDTLCSLLGRYELPWAQVHIDSTDKLFVGSGYRPGCGVIGWNGVTGLGESLCAPGDALPLPQ